jgi:hypothetical protein
MQWRYGDSDAYRLRLKQTVTSGVVRWNFSQTNNNSDFNDVLVLDRGNVGIGTTNPTTPLRIEGGAAMTGGWNKNTTLAATYPVLILNSNNSKWAGIGYDHSIDAFRIWTNGSSDDVSGTGTGINHATGIQVATDSITLNGQSFTTLPPDKPYKYLGVRATISGDLSAEKEYILDEMKQRLAALSEDRVLSRKDKEQIIVTAVCSVLRYSAGLVNWSRTELDSIHSHI